MSQLFTPAMQHTGQVTGVGDAYLFGLAQHVVNPDLTNTVYINMAGPVTSVESVWARLAERGTVIARDTGHKAHYIRHGGLGNGETPYVRYQRRIPGLQIDHLILLDRRFTEVEYNEAGVTYLFDAPDMRLKLAEHVRQLVNLPVFPEWSERLAEIGRIARLVRPLSCLGDQKVYLVDLDRTRWEHQIALRVEKGELPWPGDDAEPKPLTDIPEPEPADKTATSNKLPASEMVSVSALLAHRNAQQIRENKLRTEDPAPTPSFTFTHERDWTWLKFDEMPSEAVRDAIKRKGFRWGRRRKAWYATRRIEKSEVEAIINEGGSP